MLSFETRGGSHPPPPHVRVMKSRVHGRGLKHVSHDIRHLHVRMCVPPFYISGTAGRILMKFGAWLETNYLSVLHESRVGYIYRYARAYLFSMSRERLNGLH